MLPSDMNLKIRPGTAGYNNKILVSDKKFILGKNEKVNSLETPAIKTHKDSKTNSLQGLAQKPNFSHKKQEPHTITHKRRKLPLYFFGHVVYNMEYVSINITNLNT